PAFVFVWHADEHRSSAESVTRDSLSWRSWLSRTSHLRHPVSQSRRPARRGRRRGLAAGKQLQLQELRGLKHLHGYEDGIVSVLLLRCGARDTEHHVVESLDDNRSSANAN